MIENIDELTSHRVIPDGTETVRVGVVPASTSAWGPDDLNWTLPLEEFEALIDEHGERINSASVHDSNRYYADEGTPVTPHGDLFVLFVDDDDVPVFRDEILPEFIPESDDDEESVEDTSNLRSTAAIVLHPVREAAWVWGVSVLSLVGAVLLTLLAPFRAAYRAYQVATDAVNTN
ncbi:hypothetical protein [Halorubrum halodurans]|uniref:hypothetical protein n=1 Tax=Halorubrum halodurans TaxID=1383851 RepID=UPI00117ACFB3|nr:hypothetical protein [Halorubrum halodurans]